MAEIDPTVWKILDIEERFYFFAGSKSAQIRGELDMTDTQYYQLLNQTLDDPNPPREFAPTINRLRRLRAQRLQQRRARRRLSPDAICLEWRT